MKTFKFCSSLQPFLNVTHFKSTEVLSSPPPHFALIPLIIACNI